MFQQIYSLIEKIKFTFQRKRFKILKINFIQETTVYGSSGLKNRHLLTCVIGLFLATVIFTIFRAIIAARSATANHCGALLIVVFA